MGANGRVVLGDAKNLTPCCPVGVVLLGRGTMHNRLQFETCVGFKFFVKT